MTVLVTGATGSVGRHVVNGLLRCGLPVRAMTRNPGATRLPESVEVVAGDLARPESVGANLSGVDRVYLYPVPDRADEVLDQLRAAGVRRVVLLSSISAAYAEGDLSGDYHRAVERAVEKSGLDWTFVRPGEFMTNLLPWWAPSIAAEGVVRAPYGSGRSAMIHEADIADVAVTALRDDGHTGRAYPLTGPEALTTAERVATIGRVLGRPVRFDELTPSQARELWISQGMPPEVADWLLQPPGEVQVGPTAAEVTGRPARTFADWVADHREDFVGAS